jgi:hypothetical protein
MKQQQSSIESMESTIENRFRAIEKQNSDQQAESEIKDQQMEQRLLSHIRDIDKYSAPSPKIFNKPKTLTLSFNNQFQNTKETYHDHGHDEFSLSSRDSLARTAQSTQAIDRIDSIVKNDHNTVHSKTFAGTVGAQLNLVKTHVHATPMAQQSINIKHKTRRTIVIISLSFSA